MDTLANDIICTFFKDNVVKIEITSYRALRFFEDIVEIKPIVGFFIVKEENLAEFMDLIEGLRVLRTVGVVDMQEQDELASKIKQLILKESKK